MDGWFQENSVPEEERTLIAEETLVEEAYLQWDQDASFRLDYGLPDRTWEGMKRFMHQKFVEEPSTEPYHTRWKIPQEPRRWITVAPTKKSSVPEAMELTKRMLQVSNTKKSQEALQIGKVEARAEQKQPAAPHQGYTVSRSKPFEEGEYDVDIKSPVPKEHREDTKKLIKTLEENQLGRTKDIGLFIGAYLPNQEDLIHESTCSRKLTHQGITESWIHIKPGSEFEVIEVIIWQTSFRILSAIGPEIEMHSPIHSQSRPQTTWRMSMGLSWFQKAQETENQPTEAQVIIQSPEHVCLVPFKGNYRPDRFSNNQTYVWRPGETLNHSGKSYSILPYTSHHRIRRIPSPSLFLYLESSALKLQQLFPFLRAHDLDAFSKFQKVPRRHHFMPKLSRYKESQANLE